MAQSWPWDSQIAVKKKKKITGSFLSSRSDFNLSHINVVYCGTSVVSLAVLIEVVLLCTGVL